MQSIIPPTIEASTSILFYASNRYCGNFKLKIFQLNDVQQQQQRTLHVELNAKQCLGTCKYRHVYMALPLCIGLYTRIPSTNTYLIETKFCRHNKIHFKSFPARTQTVHRSHILSSHADGNICMRGGGSY